MNYLSEQEIVVIVCLCHVVKVWLIWVQITIQKHVKYLKIHFIEHESKSRGHDSDYNVQVKHRP